MRPEALHIELLHSCRLRCLACDHRLAGRARLSPARLRPVLADPRFRGLKLISFSGGEPLLHPGLRSLILASAKAFHGAALVLLTSLDERARLLKLLRTLPAEILSRLHIGASLDGPPDVHDIMRGSPGAFSRLEKTVSALKSDFPSLSISFTFTATSRNSRLFQAARLEARRMGVPLGIQFLVPNANTGRLTLSPGDKAALLKDLDLAAEDAPPALRKELLSARNFLSGKIRNLSCGAGRTFFMLSPEGVFYLCPFHKSLSSPLSSAAGLRDKLKGRAALSCRKCFLRCRG